MDKLRVKNIMRYMLVWRYVIYKEPYKLNIVGIRSASTQANAFDDEMLVFWYDDRQNLNYRVYRVSTDPGTYWLYNPVPGGTAILKGGQYIDAYTLIDTARFHFQTKEFLQVKNVTIVRDYDRNQILDFYNGVETTGLYGINIHTGATPNQTNTEVGQWSAGCQVFGTWSEWQEFLQLAGKHIQYNGNVFTYTLLDSRAMVRTQRRYGVYATGIASALALLYATYKITTK